MLLYVAKYMKLFTNFMIRHFEHYCFVAKCPDMWCSQNVIINYVLIGPIYVPDDFCCQDRPKGVHFSLDNKISGATFAV